MAIQRPVTAPDLIAVDGMNLVFKQYHGFHREDSTVLSSGGIETSVLFGFMRGLKLLLETFVPRGVVVVWEGRHGKQRRKDLYPLYKEGRKLLTPEQLASLYEQTAYVQELIHYLGLGNLEVRGFEADDSMYALARMASEAGLTCLVATSDKDLLQAVHADDHRVSWYDSTKNLRINNKNFELELGIRPDRFVDYKCLVKDASDNLEGIEGIGDKTAKKLLASQSLAEFMAGERPKTKREQVLFTPEGRKQVELMRLLVDLSCWYDDDARQRVKRHLEVGQYDQEEIRELFEDFAFFSLLEDFDDFLNPFRAANELSALVERLSDGT